MLSSSVAVKRVFFPAVLFLKFSPKIHIRHDCRVFNRPTVWKQPFFLWAELCRQTKWNRELSKTEWDRPRRKARAESTSIWNALEKKIKPPNTFDRTGIYDVRQTFSRRVTRVSEESVFEKWERVSLPVAASRDWVCVAQSQATSSDWGPGPDVSHLGLVLLLDGCGVGKHLAMCCLCATTPPPIPPLPPFLHLFTPYVVYRFATRSLVSPIFPFFQPKFHRSLEAVYRFVCFSPLLLSLFFFWLTLLSADLFHRAGSVALWMVLTSCQSARHNKKYFLPTSKAAIFCQYIGSNVDICCLVQILKC